MGIIQILEDKLINKIAAGEVIESPASVVKELVENSLDAQAKNIFIEIKQAGFQTIKVEDDGEGMIKEDALLSFERHATSKIKTFDDLINLSSFGFRGEALASIGSISKVDLKTSKECLGTHLVVEGSKLLLTEEIARTKGTTIEVKSLFYNVPVRRKFQRSLNYINSEIIKTLKLLALANPNIHFKLILNEKTIFSLNFNSLDKKTAFKNRALELFDDFKNNSKELDFKDDNILIYGVIGLPQVSKKNKSSQYLIVNSRVINNYLISSFIKEAYGTSISEDDYPIFALNFNILNKFIDVNVHPQKKEIRIFDSFFLKEAIKKAISSSFENHLIDEYKISFDNDINFKKGNLFQENFNFSNTFPFEKKNIFEKYENEIFFDIIDDLDNFLILDRFLITYSTYFKNLNFKDHEILIFDLASIFTKILFEKIKLKKDFKLQNLLIPINISLNENDIAIIEEKISYFLSLGIDLKISSKTTITIEAIDEMLLQDCIQDLFFLILEDLKISNRTNVLEEVYEKKLLKEITILAKKKKYSKDEAKDLLKKFKSFKNIDFDLSGSNFFIRLDKDKIDSLFKS